MVGVEVLAPGDGIVVAVVCVACYLIPAPLLGDSVCIVGLGSGVGIVQQVAVHVDKSDIIVAACKSHLIVCRWRQAVAIYDTHRICRLVQLHLEQGKACVVCSHVDCLDPHLHHQHPVARIAYHPIACVAGRVYHGVAVAGNRHYARSHIAHTRAKG